MKVGENIVLAVEKLVKYFGPNEVLKGISFSVDHGKIFGLLGPNGAGKTTTIRIITGVLPKTSGKILFEGEPLDPTERKWKARLGVVPELTNAYLDYSPLKNLIFSGRIYGLSKQESKKRALRLLKEFDLLNRKDAPLKKLSKGQKQRLNVSMALLHDPSILFLDEPTTGLDIMSARLLREKILELKNEGKTIFLTTHDLLEADRLCDNTVIMNKGEILASGSPAELRKKFNPTSKIELELDKMPETVDFLRELNLEHVYDRQNKKIIFYSTKPVDEISNILKTFVQSGITISQCQISPASLEEIFMTIFGGEAR
ncbi:MAG: ABC transporter ATP-binding protein [Candidatus Helarchaeales archaeon]